MMKFGSIMGRRNERHELVEWTERIGRKGGCDIDKNTYGQWLGHLVLSPQREVKRMWVRESVCGVCGCNLMLLLNSLRRRERWGGNVRRGT